jgi:ligand-binding sensor domain-containing protein/signal transduction histidine kinase
LVRFDGIQFSVFSQANTPEFVSSRISALYEDANGVLWIGTEGGGVVSYKGGEFKNYSVNSGLASDSVSSITADIQGNLWVATVGGALNRFRSGEFTPYTPRGEFTIGTIENMADAGAGTLWWASGNAMGYFREGEFTPIPRTNDERIRLGGNKLMGFWLVENDSLRYWTGGTPTGESYRLPDGLESSQVTVVFRDNKEEIIWIGTSGMGLYRFENNRFYPPITTQDKLSHNSILSISQDKEGTIWVGTNGGGLNRLRETGFEVYNTARGLSQNVILSITGGRDGSVWIGTDGAGLNRLRDGNIRTYGPQEGLGKNLPIWSVLEDQKGDIWVGTKSGLYHFKGLKFERYGRANGLPSEDIRSLYEDRKGRLWVGTYGRGLCLIVDGKVSRVFDSHTHPEFASDDIRSLLETSDGSLWIGTAGGGLMQFKAAKFATYRRNNGLGSDFIRALYEDKDGVLWIGTNNGLTCLRRGKFYRFSTANGLPDDVISQIFEDEERGDLWLGSNRGVFRVSRRALFSYAEGRMPGFNTVLYDRSDGLAGRECNGGSQPSGYKDPQGKLWFPTSDGISVIDPANLRINSRPPQLVIETVKADGHELKPRRYTNDVETPFQTVYRIPPGTERLEFYYAGLSYVAPRRVKYAYQLKDIDSNLVIADTRRMALYQDVPPGRYTFYVMAANSDGVANTIGKSVGVIVMPRFYQTLWFEISALVFAGFLVFAFFRYLTVRTLKRRLVVLEQQRALDRERSRIAQDMHDDLGARVTRIGLLTELIVRKAPSNDEVRSVSAKIEEAMREVVHTLDEIVWAVNPKNDTLDRLVVFITQYAEDYFEITPIRCRLDVPASVPALPLSAELRHSLFLVVKESLNNIVKHSGATEVRIEMRYERPNFEIRIEDNGKGFLLAEANQSRNGLVNMKKRIEEAGGRFELDSEKGKGTHIRLTIKLGT